jgi:hypothetical protein
MRDIYVCVNLNPISTNIYHENPRKTSKEHVKKKTKGRLELDG